MEKERGGEDKKNEKFSFFLLLLLPVANTNALIMFAITTDRFSATATAAHFEFLNLRTRCGGEGNQKPKIINVNRGLGKTH